MTISTESATGTTTVPATANAEPDRLRQRRIAGDACDACPNWIPDERHRHRRRSAAIADNCPATVSNAAQTDSDSGWRRATPAIACPGSTRQNDARRTDGRLRRRRQLSDGTANPAQDRLPTAMALGDACDLPAPSTRTDDADSDGVCGDVDNCPAERQSFAQTDSDSDGRWRCLRSPAPSTRTDDADSRRSLWRRRQLPRQRQRRTHGRC